MQETKKLGFMVTIEGVDGCGKTTTVAQLEKLLAAKDIPYISVGAFTSTELCKSIRTLFVEGDNLSYYTQIALMAAARRDLFDKVIRPAILEGKVIIVDRWIDSTIAYQAFGSLHDDPNTDDQKLLRAAHMAREIRTLSTQTIGQIQPLIGVLITIDPETQKTRLSKRKGNNPYDNKTESFYRWVETGYRFCADINSSKSSLLTIDASALSATKPTEVVIDLAKRIAAEYAAL